jgi:MATE family multidrug resistance protein
MPISVLWLAMHRVLVATGQDPDIAAAAYDFILCSLPDLVVQSFLHPLCVYLRAQSVTLPLTYAAGAALLLHVPVNCPPPRAKPPARDTRRRARRRLHQP